MKYNFVCLAFTLLLGSSAFSQNLGLLNDPVFYGAAAQNIIYPIGAIQNSVYGRYYATFEVDTTGKVKNIKVIYPIINQKISKRLGFEYEIIQGLKKTPHLRDSDAGRYILPIAFVYTNYNDGGQPTYPTNLLPSGYTPRDAQMLKEVQIFAKSNQYRTVRPYSNVAPPSRQVVDAED
ncbi:MAG: hypothetical protein U0Y10_22590 [Spirosomataceae bacterium]